MADSKKSQNHPHKSEKWKRSFQKLFAPLPTERSLLAGPPPDAGADMGFGGPSADRGEPTKKGGPTV